MSIHIYIYMKSNAWHVRLLIKMKNTTYSSGIIWRCCCDTQCHYTIVLALHLILAQRLRHDYFITCDCGKTQMKFKGVRNSLKLTCSWRNCGLIDDLHFNCKTYWCHSTLNTLGQYYSCLLLVPPVRLSALRIVVFVPKLIHFNYTPIICSQIL